MTGLTEAKRLQLAQLKLWATVKIAPSKIHGVGIFALKDMKAGKRLFADITPHAFDLTFSELKSLDKNIREIILGQFPQIVNGSRFFYPTTMLQSFCNHSDSPTYDAKADVLLADVKKGDEITEDYRKIEGYKQIFKWITD